MHKVRLILIHLLTALIVGLSPNRIVAGVTIVTHGDSSDVNGWVTGMADRIPIYANLGTNFTMYKLAVTYSGGNYFYQWSRVNGMSPTVAASGEIIIKLDWGQMTGFGGRSTRDVAPVASWLLLQTNLISELDGHALVEFPLHLIGHSRGGSLISEISRILGTNGLWVDHVTKLDPHPVNNDGNFEPFYPTDATAASTYANVLFADNYWQSPAFPDGEFVAGAYNRQLTDLSGGYSSGHSDVHLWYHCTIDGRTNASDTEASITAAQRTNWWTAYENFGARTGYLYSLLGGGDRTSLDTPVGPGFGMIRDGYNQLWDLGAGTANNRATLTTNSGNWPNLIKFNRTTTNQVAPGDAMPVKIYYQWARSNTSLATLSLFLDADHNPLNTNQTLLREMVVPGTGAGFIGVVTTNLTLFASNALPGNFSVLAKISGGGRSRFFYAPEPAAIVASVQPPTLAIARLNATEFEIRISGTVGQTLVLQNSTNLQTWLPLATNTLATATWIYTNTPPAVTLRNFYRAVLLP